MVKLIQDNSVKRTFCSKCCSEIEYDSIQDPFCDDIRYNERLKASVYHWYIKCPKCFTRIKVEERVSK